ncbi:unnamed protein product [Amoebophrya sp. A120]|nr:unnamed protein product [Amoebophrya sp. A120]|eukprot:GSA120T00024391001.1
MAADREKVDYMFLSACGAEHSASIKVLTTYDDDYQEAPMFVQFVPTKKITLTYNGAHYNATEKKPPLSGSSASSPSDSSARSPAVSPARRHQPDEPSPVPGAAADAELGSGSKSNDYSAADSLRHQAKALDAIACEHSAEALCQILRDGKYETQPLFSSIFLMNKWWEHFSTASASGCLSARTSPRTGSRLLRGVMDCTRKRMSAVISSPRALTDVDHVSLVLTARGVAGAVRAALGQERGDPFDERTTLASATQLMAVLVEPVRRHCEKYDAEFLVMFLAAAVDLGFHQSAPEVFAEIASGLARASSQAFAAGTVEKQEAAASGGPACAQLAAGQGEEAKHQQPEDLHELEPPPQLVPRQDRALVENGRNGMGEESPSAGRGQVGKRSSRAGSGGGKRQGQADAESSSPEVVGEVEVIDLVSESGDEEGLQGAPDAHDVLPVAEQTSGDIIQQQNAEYEESLRADQKRDREAAARQKAVAEEEERRLAAEEELRKGVKNRVAELEQISREVTATEDDGDPEMNELRLVFKLPPDGRPVKYVFSKSRHKVRHLYDFVDGELLDTGETEIIDNYTLSSGFPKFTIEKSEATLETTKLQNQSAVMVQRE